jgi:hypothetical protein
MELLKDYYVKENRRTGDMWSFQNGSNGSNGKSLTMAREKTVTLEDDFVFNSDNIFIRTLQSSTIY